LHATTYGKTLGGGGFLKSQPFKKSHVKCNFSKIDTSQFLALTQPNLVMQEYADSHTICKKMLLQKIKNKMQHVKKGLGGLKMLTPPKNCKKHGFDKIGTS